MSHRSVACIPNLGDEHMNTGGGLSDTAVSDPRMTSVQGGKRSLATG